MANIMFSLFELRLRHRRLVVWDSGCRFCKRWIRPFKALNLQKMDQYSGSAEPGAFEGPRIIPERAYQVLQLVSRRRQSEGFNAVRDMLAVCPLTFWIAPILSLAPIRAIGRSPCTRVAARRTCRIQ
jgi:hypothetical protein